MDSSYLVFGSSLIFPTIFTDDIYDLFQVLQYPRVTFPYFWLNQVWWGCLSSSELQWRSVEGIGQLFRWRFIAERSLLGVGRFQLATLVTSFYFIYVPELNLIWNLFPVSAPRSQWNDHFLSTGLEYPCWTELDHDLFPSRVELHVALTGYYLVSSRRDCDTANFLSGFSAAAGRRFIAGRSLPTRRDGLASRRFEPNGRFTIPATPSADSTSRRRVAPHASPSPPQQHLTLALIDSTRKNSVPKSCFTSKRVIVFHLLWWSLLTRTQAVQSGSF